VVENWANAVDFRLTIGLLAIDNQGTVLAPASLVARYLELSAILIWLK
jgi:hypothetical protein